ncbi:MAG: ABC transporter permease [Patescibacteria group bacterium]|nr:ABC transporter permease [Patescibacteria group bacterium]
MFTVISRIFHFGFKNFWRNGWLSTVTVIIMTLALFVFVGLILFNVTTGAAASSIENKIDISVYFNTNTPEDQILNIQQSLQSLPQVQSVDYISRDQALAIFTETHANDPTISQAIGELGSNPLEASLSIKAKDPSQYGTIATYLSSSSLSQYIDSISYTQNQDIIDRLARIVKDVEIGGSVVALILTLIAGLVVFNTIRLAIYSNREEIGVMRVVGASNSMARGPYVVEGILCGIISSVVALAIIAPVLYFINPYLNVFIPGLELFHYYYTHILSIFLYAVLFSAIVGGLSSFIAVKRYLKN